MTIVLPGYKITEEIISNPKTVIYRAFREQTSDAQYEATGSQTQRADVNRSAKGGAWRKLKRSPLAPPGQSPTLPPNSVILKVLKSEYPTLEEITRFRQEYKIARELECQGIVKAYSLEKFKNRLAIILEDFDGYSLKKILNERNLPIKEIIRYGIILSETLYYLHQNKIIHKDIKPSNIIVNQATGQVKITDFSIASPLSFESQISNNTPNQLEGTLAYMSPEQTGRMNRSIDCRTDLYSLGVTLYEMLTGTLPFTTTDPLELVHCHIAKKPMPPREVNPEIPQIVSDIVMKLLAKTAEDRYQSALGLKADLEICLDRLEASSQIETFSIGQQDKSGQFLIPQKLYGRSAEVATVMSAFERVGKGATEMMLVAGYSGIGKTRVVSEVHKPIVGARGYFISGKFDQYKRNIPYSALIEAFSALMRQLLAESCDRLENWKRKLLEAFGPNGQLVIDVIPEVELIVGKQPPVPSLGAGESQNRFNRVFQQFIRVFANEEHPLVVFLDDLQWADSASLKLIELLTTDADSKYLLLIGAYRDNEVGATHPLMLTLDEINKAGTVVNAIALRPLELADVNQLVAETLDAPVDRARPLAELLLNKTGGNPFFLTQLLKSLQAENLLIYNASLSYWEWNIEQIQGVGISQNVVELMIDQIQKLPEATQNALKLAACIGNRFNLDILAIVNEKSAIATAEELWPALQHGLILPLNSDYKIPLVFEQAALEEVVNELKIDYKFLHDRVQQAAYALIPDSQKKQVHLKIGMLLLDNIDTDTRSDNIFALVNHLNIGADLLASQAQKDRLATLNFTAGKRAKAATAYEAARKYFNTAIELLAADAWERQYDFTLALYVETVEAEFINANFERSETLGEIVLQKATTLLDKVKVYELKIHIYAAQLQMLKALDIGLQALQMMGISLVNALGEEGERLALSRLEDLEDIPKMTDPYKLAAMRLLMTLSAPAYQANPDIFPLIIFTQIALCIECGYSGISAFSYSWYGLILCGAQGDIESGYRAGLLALKLLDKFDASDLKGTVLNMFNVFIRPWKKHLRESLAPLMEAMQCALDVGDITYASYSACNYCTCLFLVEDRLEAGEQKQTPFLDILTKLENQLSLLFAKVWRQVSFNLRGLAVDKYQLIGEAYDERSVGPYFLESKNGFSNFNYYLAKALIFYLFENFESSIVAAKKTEEYSVSATGLFFVVIHNFYYSLALLAQYPHVETAQQGDFLQRVEKNQEKMQNWAYHAPMNFQHKYDLVEAEKAFVLGQNWQAMEYYDRAIAGARKEGFIQEEALAYELAAKFYLAHKRNEIAETYMTKAHYGYVRWGAKAKVEDLEDKYPQLLRQILNRETAPLEVTTTTSTTGADTRALDLATVLKAAIALGGEIVLDKLLDKLMKIAIENAGAQTGLLLLQKDDRLAIKAAGGVDKDEIIIWEPAPVATGSDLPLSVIHYAARTGETVVLNDAKNQGIFTTDIYIAKNQTKSVLCMPLVKQGKLVGLLYLENNLTTDAFTPQRLEILKLLSSQMAISLENASLYAHLSVATQQLQGANERLEEYSRTLEVKVEERTWELKEKNGQLNEQAAQLERALQELQATQNQLIQTEKMSSLGQLVAGVAHEINNPINFIYGNLTHAGEYIENLLHLIAIYQEEYSNPTPRIQAEIEELELDFLMEDLPKLLSSMRIGAERIRQIVLSLRNFSRLDEAEMKPVHIHQGIDSTLLILQHRLKETIEHSAIQIVKEYGELPLVECYASSLNQVFMNILSNALDALEMKSRKRESIPSIRIRTEVIDGDKVAIRLKDNGSGMTEEVKRRVFDPFYTTKPVGKGTGLGLSISYSIIVEKHGGSLSCISAPGEGTEFIIEIPIKASK